MTEILTGKEGLRAALENPDAWEVRVTADSSSDWMRYDDWRHFDLITIDMRQFRRIQKPREPSSIIVDTVVRVPGFDVNHPHVLVALNGWEPRAKVRVTVTELIDGAEPEPDWKALCELAEKERDAAREHAVNADRIRQIQQDEWDQLAHWAQDRHISNSDWGHCGQSHPEAFISEYEKLESERDNLRRIVDQQHENIQGLQRTIDAALQETVGVRQQLVACEKERDELKRRIDASAATAAVNTVAARKLHGDHLGELAEMIEMMQGALENA